MLGSIDIGVMPSRFEGLSLALLEMMAAGLPTVVTDLPGLTEAAVDGETSVVVAIGDPDQLARAILELIDDPERRQRLGQAARRRVEEHFSYDHHVQLLRSLYRGLTGRED